jgi:hypothetical protein
MWDDVVSELDQWRAERRVAQFWWRDDDAVDVTPQLKSLVKMAEQFDLPIALSVIPAQFSPRLARYVLRHPRVSVLVHGHSHVNHAPSGRAKSEFGGTRPLASMEAELLAGLDHVRRAFGAQSLPVLVPPWNRMAPRLVQRLPALGYRGISAWKPRLPREKLGPLVHVNTHLDPVDWRRGRIPKTDRAVAAALLRKLRWRRAHPERAQEPLGLLTHHLLWEPEIEHVIGQILMHTRPHPAVRWVSARMAFRD